MFSHETRGLCVYINLLFCFELQPDTQNSIVILFIAYIFPNPPFQGLLAQLKAVFLAGEVTKMKKKFTSLIKAREKGQQISFRTSTSLATSVFSEDIAEVCPEGLRMA